MKQSCGEFQVLLSAYLDGELNVKEQAQVELHLAGCNKCRTQVDDWKKVGNLLVDAWNRQIEESEFSQFGAQVFQRITPRRLPWWERLQIKWSETLAYHRAAVLSSLVTAAITLIISVPLVYHWSKGQEIAVSEVVLHRLTLEDPAVKPVIMQLENGKTLIMLVHQPGANNGMDNSLKLNTTPPSGGNL
jgi:anti-sigma factor RsiW